MQKYLCPKRTKCRRVSVAVATLVASAASQVRGASPLLRRVAIPNRKRIASFRFAPFASDIVYLILHDYLRQSSPLKKLPNHSPKSWQDRTG